MRQTLFSAQARAKPIDYVVYSRTEGVVGSQIQQLRGPQSYATLTFTVDASSCDHAPDDRTVIIFSADRVTMTVSRWKRIVACYLSLFLLAFTPSVFDAMVTLYGN